MWRLRHGASVLAMESGVGYHLSESTSWPRSSKRPSERSSSEQEWSVMELEELEADDDEPVYDLESDNLPSSPHQ